MKNRLAPFIFVLFIVSSSLQAQNWQYDFDKALDIAKETDQSIVLLFTGSDWCPPCIKLERRIFSNPEFENFAKDNFVWVKADFPKRKKNRLSKEQSQKNMELAKRYNKQMTFPVILVINKEGKVLGATGYRKMPAKRYIKLLNTFDSFGK